MSDQRRATDTNGKSMRKRIRQRRIGHGQRRVGRLGGVPLIAGLVLMVLALVEGPPASGRGASVAVQEAEFAGQAACSGCHAAYERLVRQTPHDTSTSSGAMGCEGCHGPGRAHIDAISRGQLPAARAAIFSFDGSPSENAEMCLTCHQASRETQQFDHSEHQLNGVACQTCHSPHPVSAAGAAGPEAQPISTQREFFSRSDPDGEEDRWLQERLLRASETDLCFSCHATVEAQFALPTHHRVPEGVVACTDCHNPHGSRNQPMLRSANWETCVNCHVEKRGPFLFEHAAVRIEGCTTCHTPHGSVNRNLLVRREERFLCLQCHVDPFAANVPHGRLGFQTSGDCVRCHAAVHGSNSTPFFLD
jgi:predicted CXXCH cytochrome family protein